MTPTYRPLPRYQSISPRVPSMRLPSMLPSLNEGMNAGMGGYGDDEDYGDGGSWPTPNPPISPNEESSLLGNTMGAVQYVGETFSKPGAAVRGLFGGQGLYALANLIPFSDTMGLTNAPEDQLSIFGGKPLTSKRIDTSDLFTQWGWDSPTGNTAGDWAEWLGRGTLAVAGDVIFDPLFWTNFGVGAATAKGIKAATASRGVLTKALEKTPQELSMLADAKLAGNFAQVSSKIEAGKLAAVKELEKAGTAGVKTYRSPLELANEIRSGEKTLFGGHIPFSGAPILNTNFMPREWAANIVYAAGYSKLSPYMYFRGLFNKGATGGLSGKGAGAIATFNGVTQIMNDTMAAARSLTENNYKTVVPIYRKFYNDTEKMFNELAGKHRTAGDTVSMTDAMRSMNERGILQPDDIGKEVKGLMKVPLNATADDLDRLAAVKSRMYDFMDNIIDIKNASKDELNSLGGNIKELTDLYSVEHAPRFSPAAEKAMKAKGTGGDNLANSAIRREKSFRNVPDGTILIDKIATDLTAHGHRLAPREAASGGWKFDSSTLGNFQIGQVVKASDRDNYGKIIGLKDDEALVHFISKEGIEATVPLSKKILSNANDTVPNSVKEQLFKGPKIADMVPVKLAEAEWDDAMRAELKRKYPDTNWDTITDHAELRRAYVNKVHVEPAIEKAWAADKNLPATDEFGNALKGPDGNQLIGARQVKAEGKDPQIFTYAGENERWLGEGTATQDLLDHLDKFGDSTLQSGVFSQSYLQDNFDSIISNYVRASTLRGMNHFLTQKGTVSLGKEGENWNTLSSAWQEAGIGPKGLRNFVQRNYADDVQKLVESGMDEKAATTQVLSQLKVHPQAANALKAYGIVANPANENALLKIFDGFNSYFKSMVYNVWPGGHIRDVPSTTMNQMAGGDVGPIALWKNYAKSHRYAKNKDGEGLEYIAEFMDLSGGKLPTRMIDAIGEEASADYRGVPEGGFWKSVVGGPLKRAWGDKKHALNPFAAPGVYGMKGKMNLAQDIGTHAREYQEFVQRSGFYSALREKGFIPVEALHKVNKATFDYENMSKFEKDVMRRVVPFYGWLRNNTPYQLEMLATRPGGLTSETIQAFTRAANEQDEDVYTPKFLQEQMKFPIGANNPAAQSFYGNTVLPFNDLNTVTFAGGKPNFTRSLQKLASQATPALTWIPELYAGKQLATGRNIDDLESTTDSIFGTEIPNLDRAIHYSPFSRLAGEYGKMIDERKTPLEKAAGLTGLGGISKWDTEKWKVLDVRNALTDALQSQPEVKQWTSNYIPNVAKEKMDPEKLKELTGYLRRSEQMTTKLKAIVKRNKLQKQTTP